MNSRKISKVTRVLLVIGGLALIAVLKVPMWRIELNAPQYPEGLKLLIYANRLAGDVDIVNGLNHYIGMKTLHTGDFMEFTVLPYIIIFFVAAFILVALLGNRKWFYILFFLFVSFGVIAMVDFWRWEYNYGHHLNPDAAIVVPGMAYQPPLIGFKQLLNFGAYSTPDMGGWIFAGVGGLLLLLVAFEWRIRRKLKRSGAVKAIAGMIFLVSLNSCNTGPEAIVPGKDHCDFCKMTVSDNRFGAEVITKKGKAYKFDDAHCLLSFLKADGFDHKQVKEIYFTDFSDDHSLIKAGNVFLLKSEDLKSPMAGNIAAFSSKDSLDKMMTVYKGTIMEWGQLYSNE
ncbi:MAG: nitrous oxide reductase accessory protein NosL [Bacteroidota bacterium]|nr:nitrous oxide reductase accessory protein NosL [Bacteroidota bacterium]